MSCYALKGILLRFRTTLSNAKTTETICQLFPETCIALYYSLPVEQEETCIALNYSVPVEQDFIKHLNITYFGNDLVPLAYHYGFA